MDLRLRMGKGPVLGRRIVIRGGGRPGLLGPEHPWGGVGGEVMLERRPMQCHAGWTLRIPAGP